MKVIHGRRSIESVAELRPDLDPLAENDIIEGYEIEDTDGVTVLPGAPQLLASLPADRWTVVTSARAPWPACVSLPRYPHSRAHGHRGKCRARQAAS